MGGVRYFSATYAELPDEIERSRNDLGGEEFWAENPSYRVAET